MEQFLQEHPFDILCLSETFLTVPKLENLILSNYKVAAHYCRKERIRGGVCILVKNNIDYVERNDVSDMSREFIVEYCAIDIQCINLLIICIYWNERETEIFFDSLICLLDKLKKEQHKNVIIGGDFNVNMLVKSKLSVDLKNLFLTYNYIQQVTWPTRICPTTSTCINLYLVFTNFRQTKLL